MVSVVIPNYNSGKFLCEAVASAIVQNVKKEIIVVDDCSLDDSITLLKKYLECNFSDGVMGFVYMPHVLGDLEHVFEFRTNSKDEFADTNIYVLRNKSNKGVADTRNNGVNYAKGKYVALLDSDDVWVKEKLKLQLEALEKTDAVLCSAAREHITEEGKPTGKIIDTPEKITLPMLKKTNYINCSAVVAKREVMLQYPMEHSEVHEDYLTWLKILKKYKSVIAINKPLLKYRLSKNGKSRNKVKAASMTYKTYRYAGYNVLQAAFMMIAYTFNGIKKNM